MALKATRGSIQEKNHINVLKKNVIKPLKHQEIYKNMYEHIQVTKAFKISGDLQKHVRHVPEILWF
jgi:hypothetical protein